MFLFSIVPIPMRGPDNGDQNHKPINEIDNVENQIKLLEGYVSAKTLGQEFDADPNQAGNQPLQMPGVDLNDLNQVKEVLEKRRERELELIKNSGYPLDNSPTSASAKYAEIKNREAVAEQRVADLNGLLIDLTHGQSSNPNDINVVSQELHRAESYEKILKDAESFWKKVSTAEMNTLANQPGTVNKGDMFAGLDRIIKLNGLLDSLIAGKKFDQVIPGLDTPENPNGSKDANVVRQQIFIAQTAFQAQLTKAKNEPWFNQLKEMSSKRQGEINKQIPETNKRINNLEKLLDCLIQGKPFNGVIDGLDTPGNPQGSKDPNVVRQELYRAKSLLGSFSAEKEFLSKITDSGSNNKSSLSQSSNMLTSPVSLGSAPGGQDSPVNTSNFGAGVGMLLGQGLKPDMTEKQFTRKLINALQRKTGLKANKKRIAAIKSFVKAIKSGVNIPGYQGDARTQLSYLLKLWKHPSRVI